MKRDAHRDEVVEQPEETIRDGDLVIEERMSRREGLVEYAGTTGGTTAPAAPPTGTPTYPADPLSMSTDNTPEGRLMADTVESGPITLVRTGMKVVDATGAELGKVKFVKMGDPGAATTRGQEPRETLFGELGEALFGSDMPESIRDDLVRVGFIQIDSKGWFHADHYAAANQIAGVSGDTVTLSVAKDALPTG